MKIGIITYVKCDNYGAELQAYALQYKLNSMGFDAEVLDLEKQNKKMAGSLHTVKTSIKNRYKQFGFFKGTIAVCQLIRRKFQESQSNKKHIYDIQEKHKLFTDFFNLYIKHSTKYYTLKDLYQVDMPYDVFVAGSDQIWNYMQTDFLDIYFLQFANRLHAKKISYAGSFSVGEIPDSLKGVYKSLINNLEFISVRELNAQNIVKECSGRNAEVVLDPTLLLNKQEWKDNVACNKIFCKKKYVVIYTLSGSRYIYTLAKEIAKEMNAEVINIKNGFSRIKGDEDIIHLYNIGPREFISLFDKAAYVITDSFHGTAFSINFNIPFTTLLNPSSNMNSRVLSILKITKLESRILYDRGDREVPGSLIVDFSHVNQIISDWRLKSINFLINSLSSK